MILYIMGFVEQVEMRDERLAPEKHMGDGMWRAEMRGWSGKTRASGKHLVIRVVT